MKIKQIMRATFSLKAIYQLRKAPIFLTLVMSLIIGILHFTPFTLTLIGVEPYVRYVEQLWQLTPEARQWLIQALPQECFVSDLQLNCDSVLAYQLDDHFTLLINDETTAIERGLIFTANSIKFVGSDVMQEFSYFHFEGLDFGDLQTHPEGYSIFLNRSAQAFRGVLMMPFVLGSYMTGIISFLGYIFSVSILSMLLKFGHSTFLKYKEVLNIIVFSALLPTMIAIVIGLITPAFTTLIVNLLTPIIAYLVYKKYVVFGLQNIE